MLLTAVSGIQKLDNKFASKKRNPRSEYQTRTAILNRFVSGSENNRAAVYLIHRRYVAIFSNLIQKLLKMICPKTKWEHNYRLKYENDTCFVIKENM